MKTLGEQFYDLWFEEHTRGSRHGYPWESISRDEKRVIELAAERFLALCKKLGGWSRDAIEARVARYTSQLRGSLLDDDATDEVFNAATEIYRDGLKDGIEQNEPLLRFVDELRAELSELNEKTIAKLKSDFQSMSDDQRLDWIGQFACCRHCGSLKGWECVCQRDE